MLYINWIGPAATLLRYDSMIGLHSQVRLTDNITKDLHQNERTLTWECEVSKQHMNSLNMKFGIGTDCK